MTLGSTDTPSTLTTSGNADAFVAKYSPTGVLLWKVSGGGAAGDESFNAIAVDSSGNVTVAGRFSSTANFGGSNLTANGVSDMVLAQYAGSNGAHQWSKKFGGAVNDDANGLAADASGKIYLTGYFSGTVNFGGANISSPFDTDTDAFVAKFNADGTHVWSKHFTNAGSDKGVAIAADTVGGLALVGSFTATINFGGSTLSSTGQVDAFVARLSQTDGSHIWSRRNGAPDGNESAQAVTVDADGDVLVGGYASKAMDVGGGVAAALGGVDTWIAKYAAASPGAHLWSKRIGGTSHDYVYGIAVDASDNVYAAGSFESLSLSVGGDTLTNGGSSSADVWVAKWTAAGANVWGEKQGGTAVDVAKACATSPSGHLAVGGYFFSSGGLFGGATLSAAGVADGFLARIAQ